MQLKLQRGQIYKHDGRFFSKGEGAVYFTLSVRGEYTPQEQADIDKYRLGKSLIYKSDPEEKGAPLRFMTIDSLAKGTNMECEHIDELQKIEREIIAACKQLQVYLSVAESFDGREILYTFDKSDAAP